MNHIKTFEHYKEQSYINESLVDFIKKIPFLNKYYTQAMEIVNEIGDEIDHLLSGLSKEDLKMIREREPQIKMELSKMSKTDGSIHEQDGDLVKKVLRILGLSIGALGIVSGITSMVVSQISHSGVPSTPWFVAMVVMLVVSGVTHTAGDTRSKSSIPSQTPSRPINKNRRR